MSPSPGDILSDTIFLLCTTAVTGSPEAEDGVGTARKQAATGSLEAEAVDS